MAEKKTAKKNRERLQKHYTHAEFLAEFFPNVPHQVEHEPDNKPDTTEPLLTRDEFFDILKKAASVKA
jgi:hypothetical protein